MSKNKQKPQPKRQKGFAFTGWATLNWGISHNQVFRTRKEAIDWCREHAWPANMPQKPTWQQVKKYMQVAKVKCTII